MVVDYFFMTDKIIMPLMAQTSEDGAMGLLKGMMSPTAESGVHYGPNGMKGKPKPNKLKSYETDPKAMKMLWETSEEATGVIFDL